jgi:hypothetical protein
MKRNLITGAIATLLCFGGVGFAGAQTPTPIGIKLRLGVFIPTSDGLQDRGNAWVAFGGEYKLTNLGSLNDELHPTLNLSIDYMSRNDVSELPILLNYEIHQHGFFASAGAGISYDRAFSEAETRFGYQVGVGYDFTPAGSLPVFFEAKFWGNDHSQYDGVGAYVGVHF